MLAVLTSPSLLLTRPHLLIPSLVVGGHISHTAMPAAPLDRTSTHLWDETKQPGTGTREWIRRGGAVKRGRRKPFRCHEEGERPCRDVAPHPGSGDARTRDSWVLVSGPRAAQGMGSLRPTEKWDPGLGGS